MSGKIPPAKTPGAPGVPGARGSRREAPPPARGPASPLLDLQRAAGNRSVERLLDGAVLQAKLRVGQPGDTYEREADRIADGILSGAREPVSISPISGGPGVQRMCAECEEEMLQRKPAPESQAGSLDGSGEPLPAPVRSFFEPTFRRDLGGVRVHADQRAADSARAIDAAAYTTGRHIVFGEGRYQPATTEGRRLLAHELVHVVQQSSAPGLVQRAPAEKTPAQANPADKPAGDCVQPVSGVELEALLQSRAVTVVDLWAEWCGPCKMLSADLDQLCRKYQKTSPAAPVRFFSVNVDDPANKAISAKYYTDSLPQLLIFVGPTLERRIEERPEYEITEDAIETAIDHAARSGAKRGAATGAKIGSIALGAAGLAVGLGLAFAGVLTGGLGLLAVLGLAAGGALAGAGIGAAIGAFAGWLSDKRDIRGNARRGAFEADTLIRRKFGKDIPSGTEPLHGATVRPVTQAELRELWDCRHPDSQEKAPDSLVGWTDTGPEKQAIASAENEPVCPNGKQLEHATLQKPVIYYAKDKPDATVIIHEGLHAYTHPHFSSQLRNTINEAVTEYFTRQIAQEIGAPSGSAYGNWLEYIEQLVATIGEPALRAAYFRGDFGPANRVLGNCGLEKWAQYHQIYSQQSAADVLAKRGGDYCKDTIQYPETGAAGHTEP
jgi:thiol-disulfide isomerase/thioredoxin